MTTTAKEVQAARKAGLTLAGQDDDGNPQWMGGEREWETYELALARYEHGR